MQTAEKNPWAHSAEWDLWAQMWELEPTSHL